MVKKMIAKFPEDRFDSMEELLKEIWSIRQKTAPDPALVPDVHTISINRLDYNLQNESRERQQVVKKELEVLENANKNLRVIIWVIIIVISVLVGLGIYFIFPDGVDYQGLENRIEVLELQIAGGKLNSKEIESAVRDILRQLPEKDNKKITELKRQLRLLRLNGRIRALENENYQLKQEIKAIKANE